MTTTITQEPREIAFEDIRKGDDIEARWERDGAAFTRRGIAYASTPLSRPAYWYAEAGAVVANNYDGDWKHYLHHRPAPAEPTGLGAVVRARVRSTFDRTLVRTLVRTAGRNLPWVDEKGSLWRWDDLDPDSIEVLPEGIEMEADGEQITFDEIRKGDLIRLDYPVEFGVKVTREAVAHERHGLAWHTPDGGYIVGPITSAAITLLRRTGLDPEVES